MKKVILPQKDILSSKKAAQYVAIDCEMVGVGPSGERSVLARISIVNYYGELIYDALVKPLERITDFRTRITGITAKNLKNGKKLSVVLNEVDTMIKDKII